MLSLFKIYHFSTSLADENNQLVVIISIFQ